MKDRRVPTGFAPLPIDQATANEINQTPERHLRRCNHQSSE
jgi:hypothetical protein